MAVATFSVSVCAADRAHNQAQDETNTPQNEEPTSDEVQFLGPDGKPLPPEVQAQLREQLKNNPPPVVDPNEIVVRRQRSRGDIEFEAIPERSFAPLDIGAYGASNVEELIEALGAQVASPLSQSDAAPVLLLNGKRVANPIEVFAIPTEAIERLEQFSEQVAAQYGLRADVKVLNIVTLEQFSSVYASGGGKFATEGGTSSFLGSTDLFQIDGDTRLSLGFNYLQSGALTESERDVIQPDGREDLASVRTLLPDSELISLNANLARPLSDTITASISGRFEDQSFDSFIGFEQGSILTLLNNNEQMEIGGNIAGQFSDLLLSLNVNYSELENSNLIVSADSRNIIDSSVFERQDVVADLTASGSLGALKSGFVIGSVIFEASTSDIETSALRATPGSISERARDSAGISLNLDVPISSEQSNIGRVATSYNVAFTSLSDVENAYRVNARATWTPSKFLSASVSFANENTPPSLEQLGNPTLLSPNVRTLDFITGETVDVDYLTGGNDALINQERTDFQASASFVPFESINFSINATFTSTEIDDAIAAFPLLTSSVTNAFADRFARGPDGQLLGIDIRPINFAKSRQDQIFWGFSFSRPLGKISEGQAPVGRVNRTVEELRRDYPDSVIFTVPGNSSLARQAENLTSRVFFNLYHTWFTLDEITLVPNSPALNLLDGDAVDFLGGRRQHEIEFDAGLYKGGFGARIEVEWRSSTSLVEPSTSVQQSLEFEDFATVDFSVFANLGEVFGGIAEVSWFKGTRVTLSVENLLNQRPLVTGLDGTTPIRYQGPYLDPQGRTISVSLRKAF
ncbi:MAG: hypothetical protein WBA51_04990 [Erythrobacter sp.]